MEKLPRLPVGVENFEDIRREHFYYVDKTGFIEQLLKEYGKVSLFTRPRRFGKTLNMSMLKAFFEVGTDPALFKGLKILKNEELCEQYMGRFPVVMVSLKNIDAVSYGEAQALTAKMLNREVLRLETSLRAAGEREKLCFLHYPPLYQGYECPQILALLEQYRVKLCCYGHLHGPVIRRRQEGKYGNTEFSLISGDYLGFVPKKICEK
mgnify:CR=1 FL=1